MSTHQGEKERQPSAPRHGRERKHKGTCEPWAAPAAPRAAKPPPLTPSTHSQAHCHPASTEPASQELLSSACHRLPWKREAVTQPCVAVTRRTRQGKMHLQLLFAAAATLTTQRSAHSTQPSGSASFPASAFLLMQFWGAGTAPCKPAVSSPVLRMLRETLEPCTPHQSSALLRALPNSLLLQSSTHHGCALLCIAPARQLRPLKTALQQALNKTHTAHTAGHSSSSHKAHRQHAGSPCLQHGAGWRARLGVPLLPTGAAVQSTVAMALFVALLVLLGVLGVLPDQRAASPPGAASSPGMANPRCQLLKTALIEK